MARFRSERSRRWVPALVLTIGFLATACPGASTPEGEGGGAETGAGDTGAEVANPGVLIHALGGEPEGLDPARLDEGGRGSRAIIQSYEFLVDIPPEGAALVPGLATEVPSQENGLVSEDGLTYTFPIREGVVFHDGTELTADDVLFSWDRAMTMDLPESQAFKLSETIADMRVVDDFTFEVTLIEPAALFLGTVVYSTPAAIVSQDAVESNGGVVAGEPNEFMDTNMVGTGPYQLVEWERGVRLEFEAFEDYWNGAPPLDATWEVVRDNSVGVLGMQVGDYDIIEPAPQFVEQLQGDDGVCFDESGYLLEPLHLALTSTSPSTSCPTATPSRTISSGTSASARRSTTPSTTRAISTASSPASGRSRPTSPRPSSATTPTPPSTRRTWRRPSVCSARPDGGTAGSRHRCWPSRTTTR